MITQAILPVAGYGTRFLPWTKVVPKELLPIGNKPIIALLVDECMSVGITDICFVISEGKESIVKFFEPQPMLEKEMEKRGKLHLLEEVKRYNNVKITVAYQKEMKGDGHAILQAKKWVNADMVAVLFGDDLLQGERSGLQQLEDAWKKAGSKPNTAVIALQKVPKELASKYGIVDGVAKDGLVRVKGLVEKPKPEDAPSDLGIVGKYLVPRSVIDALASVESGSKDKEIRLIDALKSGLSSGAIEIYGCELKGKRFDTGTPEGYREAVLALG